jgi:hypothetical protein
MLDSQGRGKAAAYIQLPGKTGKTRLAVNTGENMKRELFWSLNNDMLALRVPADHVMVLRTLEQTAATDVSGCGEEQSRICTHA